MIEIHIDNKTYNFPTSWKDITYERYCLILKTELKENDGFGYLELLSGIPCATLKNSDAHLIQMLFLLSKFAADFSFIESHKVVSDWMEKFNIGSHTWYKLEKYRQQIRKEKIFICSVGNGFKIYFDKDISKTPLPECWADMNYFMANANAFFEKYKRLSEYEETAEEHLAGIKRFEQFGFMAQAIELSRKMSKTYDEVLLMSAQQIYSTFLYDFEKAEYERELYKQRSKT